MYFYEKRQITRWFLLALAAMNSYCIAYAFSRGAYLAALAGVLVFAWLARKLRLLFVVAVLLATLVAADSSILPNAVTERFQSIFATEEERDESAQSRVLLWESAYDEFKEHPVLGIGFNSFKQINELGKDTHNFYIKILVESGLVGLLLLIAFLFASLRSGWLLFKIASDPFLKTLATGFLACMAALMIANLFGDRFSHYPLISYLFVYLAMIVRGIELSRAESAP
jgi:O-antigen ligase